MTVYAVFDTNVLISSFVSKSDSPVNILIREYLFKNMLTSDEANIFLSELVKK